MIKIFEKHDLDKSNCAVRIQSLYESTISYIEKDNGIYECIKNQYNHEDVGKTVKFNLSTI